MDAARAARRLGAALVQIVYRRTRAQLPADPDEVQACLDEGIDLLELLSPARVVSESGKVAGLLCRPMALGEPDARGRRQPVPAPGPEVQLAADAILSAVGQAPALEALAGLDLVWRGGLLEVDPLTRETSVRGVFAGGDLVRGPSSVIQAIADGRAAAEAIARREGLPHSLEPRLEKGASAHALLARRARIEPWTIAIAAQAPGDRSRLSPEAAATRGEPMSRVRRALQPLRLGLSQPRDGCLRGVPAAALAPGLRGA